MKIPLQTTEQPDLHNPIRKNKPKIPRIGAYMQTKICKTNIM